MLVLYQMLENDTAREDTRVGSPVSNKNEQLS